MVLNNSFQPKGRRHGIAEPEIETGQNPAGLRSLRLSTRLICDVRFLEADRREIALGLGRHN